jgi:hypothetical protein
LVLLSASLLSLSSGLLEPPQAHPNLRPLASLCGGQFRLPGTYAVEEFSMDALEVGAALLDHAVARPHEHPDLLDMPWRHPRLWQPFGHVQVSEVPRINTRRPLSSPDRDLGYVVEGLSNAEIGRRLYLSESTIKQNLRAVYKLLGVSNRTEAANLLRRGY